MRKYLDAFRAEGLRVGLYYSLVDWHHPDYPAFHDPFHPQRGSTLCENEHCDFNRYLDYMHAQVRELCTSYGKLDLLWFDFSYEMHSGEDWRATQLVDMVRTFQPDILINSRLEASGGDLGSLRTDNPTPWAGDFTAPEQIIPPAPLTTPLGQRICWEACQTMNESSGYNSEDTFYKSPGNLVQQLVDCVSKGGNYLLNVGPDARGIFPAQARKTLQETGEWMRLNGESIYSCSVASRPAYAFGCLTTERGNKLYLHVLHRPVGPLAVSGLRTDEIHSARLLSIGAEVEALTSGWAAQNYPDYTFLNLRLPFVSLCNTRYPIDEVVEFDDALCTAFQL